MKLNDLALKAKTQYSTWDNSNWHCYYHALSGDELSNQILSLFYKPNQIYKSHQFSEVSQHWKMYEEQGIVNWLKKTYEASDEDCQEALTYAKQFLNEAKIEFTGRKFCD